MKKMRKGFALVLMTAIAILCCAVAACAGGITFKFETNGGNSIENMKVTKGEEITLPIPEREGFSFEGWFDNAKLSGNPVAEKQTAEQSRTFYAKWEQMYLVTLDVTGGSVSSTSLYLKKGTNLVDALKEYVPVKENFRFGEWLYDGKALNATDMMPEENITLTAHYMVGYTVERYLQSLDDPAVYEKGENYIGYAYASNSAFSLDPNEVTPTGFNAIQHEGDLTQKVIGETFSENVFKMYFNRAEIRILLYANYPDGERETEEFTGLYGEEVLLPESNFYASGYCLTGWSTSITGEDAIPSNYLNAFLFGATDEDLYYYKLEENAMLYGIWTKGYIDNFESIDYIYHFTPDAKEVYLERAGTFFKGEYDAATNGFLFYDDDQEIVLEGIFNDANGTFAYYVNARQRNLSLYVMGTGLDSNTVLVLDELNNIIYSRSEDDGQGGKTLVDESKGTYSYHGGAEYEATFTSGELAGTSFVFIQGTATVNNVQTPVFSIRDEESYSLGIVAYVAMYQGAPLVFPQNLNAITFNGYGVAAMNTGTSSENYYYRFAEEKDTFDLYDTSTGSLLETCKIVEVSGRKAYCTYDRAFDNTFISGTETLTLDGLYNATYSADTVVKGYYTATASAFGGYIVTFRNATETRIFHVYSTAKLENNQPVIEYHFDKKAIGYSEYYYKNDQNTVYFHYAPLIVLNANEEGDFALYAIDTASTTTRIFVKVAEGTYTEENGKRHATITKYMEDVSYLNTPIAITDLAEIVFDTAYVSGSDSNLYPVAYWYSVTPIEGEEQSYETVYEEEEGETSLSAKLSLIAGLAILTFEVDGQEVKIAGSYIREDNILVIITSDGKLSLEMNDEKKTFVILNSLLGTVYAMGEDGVETRLEYIDFDGKDGAVYSTVTPAATAGEEAKVTSYTGTYEETGKTTAFGGVIYRFTGTLNGGTEEKVFEFLLIRIADNTFFTKHNADFEGEYNATDADGDTLTLDGFCFNASLSTDSGLLEGIYFIRDKEKKVICFLTDGASFYFDITAENTFARRGNEFASYLLMRNQGIGDESIELDGHGNFTIFTFEEGARKTLHSGTYTYEVFGGTQLFTLVYEEDSERHTIRGIRSSIQLEANSDSYNTFVVYDEEIVTILVNEADLSVLALDGFGNAIRYNSLGIPELGQYVLINENLFYYANRTSSDACIYTYDLEKGTAVPSDFTPHSYFTKDLDAMVFYSYGFMIYGGETRYYYNIKDSKVYLYHRDDDDPKANKYGFVEEEFGTFGSSITWKEKEYYVTNGYQLMFTRAEENKNDYPVTLSDSSKVNLENLTFTPTGATEFRVRGSVVLNGNTYACYVERELDKEQNLTMTLILGSYYFDLEVEYTGEEDGTSHNTYTLKSMRFEQSLPSIYYLASVYMYALQGLTQPQNAFGVITITDTYNVAGDVDSQTATGKFTSYSGLVDSKNKTVDFENVAYTEDRGLYTIEIKGSDEAVYRIHFTLDNSFASLFGLYGYNVYAFTRAETLTAEGGYEMEIERVIATDNSNVKIGNVYDVHLKKNGTEIKATDAYFNSQQLVITHIVRTFDEQGNRTGATYYVIKLKEKKAEGADEVLAVPFLESAAVTEKTVKTVNGVESNTYADYTEETGTKTVELVVFQGAVHFATETEVQEDGKLLVTTETERHFTVDVENHSIALVTE